MRRRLRQNATNISKSYIGRPYIYRMSNIYVRHPGIYIRQPGSYIRHPGAYIRHPGTYIQHPGTYIRHPGTYIRRPISISDVRYNTRLQLGQGLGQGYRMSDIDIRRLIYILDVRYIYWKSDIYIGRPI